MTSYLQLSKGDCSEGDISLLLYLYTNFHEIHQNSLFLRLLLLGYMTSLLMIQKIESRQINVTMQMVSYNGSYSGLYGLYKKTLAPSYSVGLCIKLQLFFS